MGLIQSMSFLSGAKILHWTIIITFVARLPIIQGGTFAYLVPTFAILNLPKWQCPEVPSIQNLTENGTEIITKHGFTEEQHREIWQSRIREVRDRPLMIWGRAQRKLRKRYFDASSLGKNIFDGSSPENNFFFLVVLLQNFYLIKVAFVLELGFGFNLVNYIKPRGNSLRHYAYRLAFTLA